jgi:hypothetical protein
MFHAAIQIYRIKRTIDASGARSTETELVAVAPLEMRDQVSIACSKRNAEAVEAKTGMYYCFDIKDCQVFTSNDTIINIA